MLEGQRVFVGVPQEVGCANSVSGVLEMVDPSFFGNAKLIDRIDSTIVLNQTLRTSKRFVRLDRPVDGCIIMSPTQSTSNVGHVGIYDNGRIWNNNSATGKWLASYRFDQWKKYFEVDKGLKTFIYFPLSI
jgi:hypothetical protein